MISYDHSIGRGSTLLVGTARLDTNNEFHLPEYFCSKNNNQT